MSKRPPAGLLGMPWEPERRDAASARGERPLEMFDPSAIDESSPTLGAHLLVGLYNERDPRRRDEIDRCLASNLQHPDIAAVHVFDETDGAVAPPYHPKMVVVPFGRRVTYADFFGYASRELAGSVCMVANSDIFFDETLQGLRGYPMGGRFLALTRWDEQPDGTTRMWTNPGSQDTWVFLAPLREFPADWHLGLIACDNRIAYEAARAGLEVTNPARDLRTRHLHLSEVRHYTAASAVPGPRLNVPIGGL